VSVERTLVLVKPDGLQRGLVGELIARLERRGLQLIGLKLMRVTEDLAVRHYVEHAEKPFFGGLVDFITAAPVVAMVWEGRDAVGMVRAMMGATDPARAAPGTIRGDLAVSLEKNVIHGSDSVERAGAEIALFFSEDQLVSWERMLSPWLE